MADNRIPVVLLTGGLGSGKTTLLAEWLRQPALRNAALIINEIGQVGLDDRLLLPHLQASDSAALLANMCVCCSGLPGLEEALADLYRGRLERRIARFDRVVIETTGLAEPQPVRAVFQTDSLLRERYALTGVITTVSATAPAALDARDEFQAQVRGADLLVITKTDCVPPAARDAVAQRLRALNSSAALAMSSRADLAAAQVLELLATTASALAQPVHAEPPTAAPPQLHDHHHRHHADVVFVAMPRRVGRAALAQRLLACIASTQPRLLRLKGVAIVEDGSHVAVQWAPGDEGPVMSPFSGSTPPEPGLSVIATDTAAARDAAQRLERAFGAAMPGP